MVTKVQIPFREIKAISREVSPDWQHFAITVFVCMTEQGDNSRERIVSRLVIGRIASERRRENEGGDGKRSIRRERETLGGRKERKFKGKTTTVPRILDRARFAAVPGLEILPFPRPSALSFLFLQPGRTSPPCKALENISSYRGIISAVGNKQP